MKFFRYVGGLLIGLTLSLAIVGLAGENPWSIFMILIKGSFGSSYDLGLTLFYTTSLIFTGLSVSIAFRAGLFNIGAEGQLTISALSMVILANQITFRSPVIAIITITFVGFVSGAFWGFIPGLLKAKRNSHEVIVTMMLNFIAAALASYSISSFLQNPDSQNPESILINEHYRTHTWDFIKHLSPESPLNIFLIVSIVFSFLVYILFEKTVLGYELMASGQNSYAARRSGISEKYMTIFALSLSGLLSSGAALNEVVGNSGQFKIGFSPDFGYMGIAVALMSNNHPLAIIANAFILSIFHKGAGDLDLETNTVTKDFSKIIQALILFGVGFQFYLNQWLDQRKSKNK